MFLNQLKGAAMIYKPINNKGQARIFKNRQLEQLSKTQPWVNYSIYIPVIIIFVAYAWLGAGHVTS